MKTDTTFTELRQRSERRSELNAYISGIVERRRGYDRRDTRCALEIEADNAFVNAESEKWFRAFN
jgi:hypothetical protein